MLYEIKNKKNYEPFEIDGYTMAQDMAILKVQDEINTAVHTSLGKSVIEHCNDAEERALKKITKEEKMNEQEIMKWLVAYNIMLDEKGSFEAYCVVDADNDDYQEGTVILGEVPECYLTKEAAFEDMKTETRIVSRLASFHSIKSIKEELALRDKLFAVSVNQKDVISVDGMAFYTKKIKVINEVELKPELMFDVIEIEFWNKRMLVKLFNSISLDYMTVVIDYDAEDVSKIDVRQLVEEYIRQDDISIAKKRAASGVSLGMI